MKIFRRGPEDLGTMDRPGGVLAVVGGLLAALAMLAIGGSLLLARLGRREHRAAGALVLACSAFIALAYLIPFNALRSEIQQVGASGLGISAATFAGGGFWFALVGALIAATGAALELSEPRRSLRAGA